MQKRKEEKRHEARKFIFAFLSGAACIDCGCNNILVLQFDHVRGAKKTEVSELVALGYPIETIKLEIEKCEIRCANCHTIRTKTQDNSWMVNFLPD